jgi:hypothetical protein
MVNIASANISVLELVSERFIVLLVAVVGPHEWDPPEPLRQWKQAVHISLKIST